MANPNKGRPAWPHKGCGMRGARKARHLKKASSTSGKTKGAGCVASWRQRGACRRSRSYKWEEYAAVMDSLGKAKSKAGA